MDTLTELHINIYVKMNGLWNDSKDVLCFTCNEISTDVTWENVRQYNKP